MKARLENGVIKLYNTVPDKFTYTTDKGSFTFAGGVNNISDNKLKEFGFFDVVTPTYDSRIEELSNLHLDGDVYTYDVIEKPIKETLSELKKNKVDILKSIVGNYLSETDWYIIREADSGEATPADIRGERAALRSKSDSIEAEINALTTKKAVVLFDINL